MRIALPEPTSTDAAYNQRAWAPYFHSLMSSGAVGVPIPLDGTRATIEKLMASCVGVLLPGSPADVDPRKYGAVPAAECAKPDVARQEVDEFLLETAYREGIPLLGICYGLQALNTWRGGTLVQHLPAVTKVDHDPGPEVLSAHSVRLTAGSRLETILGASTDLVSIVEPSVPSATVVNSSHHQGVDLPGEGLIVSARCVEDGTIEALEAESSGTADQFLVAVQWHPERSFDSSEASRHLFKAFVDAAVQYRSRVSAASMAG
ncbi:hypothetical protein ACPOL_2287 [Acidisarcina polymorpha]|uniref:Uncharacterized protein n=1 Tax=Acidisarcina polymorpha TaxID=2211140 RepID=A0A2Z5FXM4_9BACT|nr:hypothetical protein ACPOL_2287 [Acidisarcina polymorpha]